MKAQIKTILLLFTISISNYTFSQTVKTTMNKKEIKTVVNSTQSYLIENYVNFELAKKMSTAINNNLNSGKYYTVKRPEELSISLTSDLQTISKDLHLKVNFEPKRIANMQIVISTEEKNKREQKQLKDMQRSNFGFSEVKVLDGNIGYLDLRYFADIKYAKETLESSLTFLRNTSAIIIDLRQNGGGVPSTLKLLSSYFFDENPVLLSRFYNRSTNKTEEFSTESISKDKNLSKTDLYILTSKSTFSAAEAFAYNLKHLSRATVIGEVTKGGANRTKRFKINNNFTISVPYIKSIHPVTKSNWEGKGVIPNIKTSSKEAFITAYISSIDKTFGNHPMKNKILNGIGYSFLKNNKITDAITVFKANTKLHPTDANVWDSLGEAYFVNRDKENSIKSYEKALSINPEMSSAIKMLEKLINK